MFNKPATVQNLLKTGLKAIEQRKREELDLVDDEQQNREAWKPYIDMLQKRLLEYFPDVDDTNEFFALIGGGKHHSVLVPLPDHAPFKIVSGQKVYGALQVEIEGCGAIFVHSDDEGNMSFVPGTPVLNEDDDTVEWWPALAYKSSRAIQDGEHDLAVAAYRSLDKLGLYAKLIEESRRRDKIKNSSETPSPSQVARDMFAYLNRQYDNTPVEHRDEQQAFRLGVVAALSSIALDTVFLGALEQ